MTSKSPSTGLIKRLSTKFTNFFSRPETPRQIQERKDLYMALLASTYKSLRISKINNSNYANADVIIYKVPRHDILSKQEKQLLIEEATQSLEDKLVHQMTILELRQKLQSNLVPEIQVLFKAFSKAEKQLLVTSNDLGLNQSKKPPSRKQNWNKQNKDENKMKPLLLQEFDTLSHDLMMKKNGNNDHDDGSNISLNIMKLGAIKTILDYKGWLDPSSHHLPVLPPSSSASSMDPSTSSYIDEFGYYSMENHNIEIQQIMRNNQLLNLSISHILKETLGYSTIALRSTLNGAGRGIYIDGYAPAGTIVSFFPGEVWPRDFLQNPSIASHFEKDDSFQLSLRYDDILIDSRKSPAVVLDIDGSNPWALAHLANHPPKPSSLSTHAVTKKQKNNHTITSIPNCRPLALNYTSDMRLTKELKKYIPNRYARKPSLLGFNEAFERQDVNMHGLVLVTTRDVENEELFYDYRFSPPPLSTSSDSSSITLSLSSSSGGSQKETEEKGSEYPEWYHICDEDGMKNRWG